MKNEKPIVPILGPVKYLCEADKAQHEADVEALARHIELVRAVALCDHTVHVPIFSHEDEGSVKWCLACGALYQPDRPYPLSLSSAARWSWRLPGLSDRAIDLVRGR